MERTLHTYDINILDHLLEGCQIINHDWQYVYVNHTVVRHSRKRAEELLGHTMMAVFPGIEETQMFQTLKQCMESRQPDRLINEFIFDDQTSGWFELSIQPVPEGLFIFSNEITDRVMADKKIKNQLSRLKALREIDVSILGSIDLTVALKTVLRETKKQLNLDAVDILLLNHFSSEFEHYLDEGLEMEHLSKANIPLDQGFIDLHFNSNAKHYRFDLNTDLGGQVFAMRGIPDSFKSYYVLPLVAKGKINGVMEVFQKSSAEMDEDWIAFLEALAGQASMAIDNYFLFNDLLQKNLEITVAYNTTIEGWSRALDLRDKETEGHTLRVTDIAIKLAKRLGFLDSELVDIKYGALLHDIGKLGVPDSIFYKAGPLTPEEFEIMKLHVTYAYELLSPIRYLGKAIDIPYGHHEKWDGSGYPRGLKGEQIPLSARLFAVVDVWDALSTDRVYRKAWAPEEVIAYLKDNAGSHFDPKIVPIFIEMLESGAFN